MMNVNFEFINAVGSIATAIGVFMAWMQLMEAKKQAVTNFEDQFAKEYRALMNEVPIQAFLGNPLSQYDLQNAMSAFFHYADLCNEQIFLRQQGRISKETWESWCSGIKSNSELPAFRAAWEEIKPKTTSFAELKKLEQEKFQKDPITWGRAHLEEKAKKIDRDFSSNSEKKAA